MIYYYIICNYVINTPIGIWPLILYCFLLAARTVGAAQIAATLPPLP